MANAKRRPFSQAETFIKLFYACRAGHYAYICNFVEQYSTEELHAIVDEKLSDGYGQVLTPLLAASLAGHVFIVNFLISKLGANIESTGVFLKGTIYTEGVTPLWCATGKGHLNVIKVLVRNGANVNCSTVCGSTPLHEACLEGRIDIVEYLLKHGADIDRPDLCKFTPLMVSSEKGDLDIVKCLLRNQANTHHQAFCGSTALLFAAKEGYLEIVRELVEYGAQLIPTNKGITPVLAAANGSHSKIVEYLLSVFDLPIEDQINAYELLGASYATKSVNANNDELRKCYFYLYRAMELRFSRETPIYKVINPPIPAYDNWEECVDFERLRNIEGQENELKLESLTIRERILGNSSPNLVVPIIFRGYAFASQGMYNRCLNLWMHALQIAQNSEEPLFKELRIFPEVLSVMVSNGVEISLDFILRLLEINTAELEKNVIKLRSSTIKINPLLVPEPQMELDENLLIALYLVIILTLILKRGAPQDLNRIYQLIFKLVQVKACNHKGMTILHLCVDEKTYDGHNTIIGSLCQFPCQDAIDILIRCGADVNARDKGKDTPLHFVAKYARSLSESIYLPVLQSLLKGGAHIDPVNAFGQTPLEYCRPGPVQLFFESLQFQVCLKCLAARAVAKCGITDFRSIPNELIPFIELHTAQIGTPVDTPLLLSTAHFIRRNYFP